VFASAWGELWLASLYQHSKFGQSKKESQRCGETTFPQHLALCWQFTSSIYEREESPATILAQKVSESNRPQLEQVETLKF